MKITNRAIEDAAYVTYEVSRRLLGLPLRYEDVSDDTRVIYRTIARAALEAAMPHLMEGAEDDES